jgi:hypothetical protein
MSKKESLVFLFLMLVTILTIYFASAVIAPNPGHTASEIYVKYSPNCYVSLQNAVNKGYLSQVLSVVSPTSLDCKTLSQLPKSQPYALASDVLITIKGQKMTLQQAVESGSIGGTVKSLSGGVPFTTSLNSYEDGSNIKLADGTKFIDSINSGTFACNPSCSGIICGNTNACGTTCSGGSGCSPQYAWDSGSWTGPSTHCGAVQYRQITCKDASGNPVDPSNCDINSVPNNKRTLNCGWVDTGTTCDTTTTAIGSCSISGGSITFGGSTFCSTFNLGQTKTCNTGEVCGSNSGGRFDFIGINKFTLTQQECQSNWVESFIQYIWAEKGDWTPSTTACGWNPSNSNSDSIKQTETVTCENLLTGGDGGNNCDSSIKPSGVRYPSCTIVKASGICKFVFSGKKCSDVSFIGGRCVGDPNNPSWCYDYNSYSSCGTSSTGGTLLDPITVPSVNLVTHELVCQQSGYIYGSCTPVYYGSLQYCT